MSSKSSKSKTKKKEKNLVPLDPTIPNPNLYFGCGSFDLPNGDRYEGGFCAHKLGLVWREGHGTYITREGQTYECQWTRDCIIEGSGVIITYPTGEVYTGTTLNDQYSGAGTYYFQNTMPMSCEFTENRPVGHVVVVDLNGRIWEGDVQPQLEGALLLPENTLYTQLNENIGKGKERGLSKKKESEMLSSIQEESEEAGAEEEEMPMEYYRQLEQIIFATSKKTESDIDFNESEWCQKFLKFKELKSLINAKVEKGEELTPEEQVWLERYTAFKENLLKPPSAAETETEGEEEEDDEEEEEDEEEEGQKSPVDTTLLDQLHSEEYAKRFIPIPVIHPSEIVTRPCLKDLWRQESETEENTTQEEAQ